MENKKAQVTMFVILGVVILLAASLYFFMHYQLTKDQPGIDVIDVSLETRPMFQLVEGCLQQVTLDGLEQIGRQGGWIDFSGLKISELPYDSDVVYLPPNNVVYWRHLDDCGTSNSENLCEESNKPPLCKPGNYQNCFSTVAGDNSIQEQLENYIIENIDSCLDNFKSLENQYDIEVLDDPTATVYFYKEDTKALLNYPIKIKSLMNDNTKTVEEFLIGTNLKFAEMYNLADEIVDFAKESSFYESQTMNLISIYSGMDKALPPTDGITFFSPQFNYWNQFEINEILRYDLLPFMGAIRYMNFQNFYPIVEEMQYGEYKKYSQGMYSSMTPKLGNNTKLYPYDLEHQYLYAPIYSKVGNGEAVLQPKNLIEGANEIMKMAGLYLLDYRFEYDMRYPLILSLKDPDALNGQGFELNFAIEVNIQNNIGGYNNFTTLEFPTPFETGLGDFQTRLPQNITMKTYNKYSEEDINDVVVSYICGREVDVGTTKFNYIGDATLTSQLPYCEMGGYLKFKKQGFAPITIPYDNKLGSNNTEFVVGLWPLKEKEIVVRKRTVQDIETIKNAGEAGLLAYQNAHQPLSPNQSVMLTITNVKENPYDSNIPLMGFLKYIEPGVVVQTTSTSSDGIFTEESIENAYQSGSITGEDRQRLLEDLEKYNSLETTSETYIEQGQEKYTLDLSPGTYNLDASLFDYTGLHIPNATMDACPDGFFSDLICDQDDIKLPEQNFSMWLLGGVKRDFTISPALLYGNNTIYLYVLEMPKPTSWDDLMNVETLDQYQETRMPYTVPQYK